MPNMNEGEKILSKNTYESKISNFIPGTGKMGLPFFQKTQVQCPAPTLASSAFTWPLWVTAHMCIHSQTLK